jgi:hypothetical protein
MNFYPKGSLYLWYLRTGSCKILGFGVDMYISPLKDKDFLGKDVITLFENENTISPYR